VHARLSRIPRWAWIAFAIGVIVPLVILAVGIIFVAITTGLIVLAAVVVVGGILSLIWRLMHRKPRDGRKNVQIVVRSARIID